jgi:transcriptional regulator with GAF, ATPase, and Fis domain
MDENEFFRDATTKICGHLEIEVALFECLKYLKSFIPVESMNLSVWEPEFNSIRVIARATENDGQRIDALIPMSDIAKAYMEDMNAKFKSSKWLDTDIINDATTDPGMLEIVQQFDLEESSLMHLILETVDRPLCSILLFTQGKDVYTKRHAQILDLLKEPFSIAMSNALRHREVTKFKELLADDNQYLKGEIKQMVGESIIGANFGLKQVMYKAEHAANVDSPVLLLGETGVGKDVIANAIHYSSARRNGPFIKVNCGAIPDSLLDSELFGHEKGAFTGAFSQKRGRFERADTGTIFLDEIGELPLEAQIRLMRVLQNKEIERVGGEKTIKLDIRIIAATNRDLEEMLLKKEFREDLFFRLNVFPISIPPLRDRPADIPALLQYSIELKSKELKLPGIPGLSPGAIDPLLEYHWPGNIRELQNLVERELILNPTGPLNFENIKDQKTEKPFMIEANDSYTTTTLDEMNTIHIQKVLNRTEGKIHGKGGAAEILGINANTLRNRMNKLGIEYRKKETQG